MIMQYVKAWEENKSKLELYFKTNIQDEYSSYAKILTKIVEICFSDIDDEDGYIVHSLDDSKITIIDNGYNEGTLIFIIPTQEYSPSKFNYVWTDTKYGSCSGCDTLEAIIDGDYDKLPTDKQVADYMTLSLHLVQKLKWLCENIEEDKE